LSEDLQKQLAAFLQSLLEATGDVKQFAADQIPPLVQEKIMLGRVEEVIWLLASSLLMYVGYRLIKFGNAEHWDDSSCFIAGVGGVLAFVVGPFLWLYSLHYVIEAWFAPRLYIVEWLQSMVTK